MRGLHRGALRVDLDGRREAAEIVETLGVQRAGSGRVRTEATLQLPNHPEVYIMALPAFGMISEIIPVFSRKLIFGYFFVSGSTVAIGLLSFIVWAHHMFAVGMSPGLNLFFSISSMLIAVPTGVKVFNWLATLWGGSIRFATPMLFATAFLIQFTIGGLTGVSFGHPAGGLADHRHPTTWWRTMHYVLFGGSLFGVFAAIYYWFPKIDRAAAG
ncbi:MAG: hypothetical protein HC783_15805, partial [Rhodobacteraceae bacterium]|nr:hypothetical protein [Paracoccaceae bacterium]